MARTGNPFRPAIANHRAICRIRASAAAWRRTVPARARLRSRDDERHRRRLARLSGRNRGQPEDHREHRSRHQREVVVGFEEIPDEERIASHARAAAASSPPAAPGRGDVSRSRRSAQATSSHIEPSVPMPGRSLDERERAGESVPAASEIGPRLTRRRCDRAARDGAHRRTSSAARSLMDDDRHLQRRDDDRDDRDAPRALRACHLETSQPAGIAMKTLSVVKIAPV